MPSSRRVGGRVEVGGRVGSPYTDDGLAREWDDEQRLRAARYGRLAGSLAGELDRAAAKFHDPTLRWITTVAANVAEKTRAALAEQRVSPAANVLATLVRDIKTTLEAWLRDPASSPVLSGMAWDWYDEIRDSAIYTRHEDRSESALISRVFDRYLTRIGGSPLRSFSA